MKSELATTEYIIAANFFTKRALNMDAIAATFQPLWQSKNGFRLKNLGNHIVLFIFENKADVDNILANEPWSYDKNIMVLQRYEADSEIADLSFNLTHFWVQVHGIPVRFMNKEVAEGLCETVGQVCHLHNAPTEDGGSFMRVRVLVDISLPLCRGRVIALDDNREQWVTFRYERLPNLCFWCGCLTHSDKDCDRWIESEGMLAETEKQYGPWIKALPFNGKNRAVVSVLGFYTKRSANSTAEHS
ncbi:uncharacterized protein At4g02000-like [Castanea sativa]|uniref:uncharacterized protein At4g02000-like n=1 Tax=Castanea sativa TaxID=21020 RepID=UPI003F6519F5